VYEELNKLSEGSSVIFLPLPTVIDNSDATFLRQFEYMYNAQYHRLKLFNGISGFFPPHYRQGMGLLKDFPSISGLNFILKNDIDYIVHDKNSSRMLDFSIDKLHLICESLSSIYDDRFFRIFKVNRMRAADCLARAGGSPSDDWLFMATSDTPHLIGKFNSLIKALVSEPGETGVLVYGPYISLEKGRYRASFTIEASAHKMGSEVGAVDVVLPGSDKVRQGPQEGPVRLASLP
jgi:hypothetical protein